MQLISPDFIRDPYPLLEILRENYPCYRDWLENSMLADGYISPQDVESLLVTDDPNDCHGALDAVEHRRPRRHRKAA